MKKTFRTLIISLIAVLMLFTSCNDKLQKMEEGSVNEYIYPYIKFKPAEDGNSVTAVVVAGAKLNIVKIPATVDGVKVNTFIGFENPEDAKSVKEIVIGSHETVIAEEAFKQAENLEEVKVESNSFFDKWGELPVLEKDGYEFLGWYVGDDKVYQGMPMDPNNSNAIPKWKAHKYIYHEGKPATCTESGIKEYWECPDCGKKFATNEGKLSDIVVDVEIASLGHDLTLHEMVKPTCTKPGTRAYYECSRCHLKFSDENGKYPLQSIDIPKLEHDLVLKEEVPATCEHAGYKSFYVCKNCDQKFEDEAGKIPVIGSLVIEKLDHVFEEKWTTNDSYHWHYCSLCHKEKSDYALHDHNKKVITKQPGPSEIGEYVMECKCGHRTAPVPMTRDDHTFDSGVKVEPTCTDTGFITYRCTKCGYSYKVELPALNHKYSYKVAEQVATCQKEGVVEHWHCPDCGLNFTDNTFNTELKKTTIDKLDHKYETTWRYDNDSHWHECELCHQNRRDVASHDHYKKVITKKPGPGEIGEYVMECECGHRTDPTPMTEKDHNLGILAEQKPTCTEDGWITYYCKNEGCKFTYSVITSKLNHKNAYEVKAKDPTCTVDGNVYHWHCEDCGLNFTDNTFKTELKKTTIDKLAHQYETTWRYDKDSHWHECELCHQDRIDVAMHDHSKKVITKKPGPGEIGEYVMECECGHRTDPTPMTEKDHNLGILAEQKPTCTEDGWITYYCKNEGCKFTYSVTVPKLNHKNAYEVKAKDPTCIVDGNIYHWHCEDCGLNYADGTFNTIISNVIIDKLGHDFTGKYYDDGNGKHYQKCSRCDAESVHEAHEYNLSEKLPNDLNLYHSATCTESAEYYKICKCGAFNYKDISTDNLFTGVDDKPLGHNLVHHSASDKPCAEGGNIEYWECARCQKKFSDADGKNEIKNIRADHTPALSYISDSDNHYLKCSVCDEILSIGAHDSNVWNADDEYHWRVCSVCGYEVGARSKHVWEKIGDDYYCKICSCKAPEKIEGNGGFDIEVSVQTPKGHLEMTDMGNHRIKFVFADDNPNYPPTFYLWSVNDVSQNIEGNEFILDVKESFSYQVKCMVRNEWGVFSDSVMLDGETILNNK